MVLILFKNKFIARQNSFTLVKRDLKRDVCEEYLLIIYFGKDLDFKWQMKFKKLNINIDSEEKQLLVFIQ